jgi:hypothetical protein
MYVWLSLEEVPCTVSRGVVDREKPINSDRSVVLDKERQPICFIITGEETENVPLTQIKVWLFKEGITWCRL